MSCGFKIALIPLIMVMAIIGASVYAEDVKIIGQIEHHLNQLHRDPSLNQYYLETEINDRIIQLLQIELSDEERALLLRRGNDALSHLNHFALQQKNAELSSKIQLGMNNVPVLDQGTHGTCVTFAVTGALDAIINKGDYVSQLCSLQLGSYLEQLGQGLSGWDGSSAVNVINQIAIYGIVNKQQQRKNGCGGLKEYPSYSAHNSLSFMSVDDYSYLSSYIFGTTVNWYSIYQHNDPEQTLNEVKQSLQNNNRVVFAVLLPRTDLGFAGAVAKHKTWIYKDTWVLTSEIISGLNSINTAHEMIISGYNDDAIAVDDHGINHKGLLTLRNSWSSSYGDWGNFYMSYDYFKLLTFDVIKFT